MRDLNKCKQLEISINGVWVPAHWEQADPGDVVRLINPDTGAPYIDDFGNVDYVVTAYSLMQLDPIAQVVDGVSKPEGNGQQVSDRAECQTTHYLKCVPEEFAKAKAGTKRHETRVADRDYKEGDRVVLREYDPASEAYTGEVLSFTIGSIASPGTWGLPLNICVFTLLDIIPTPVRVEPV